MKKLLISVAGAAVLFLHFNKLNEPNEADVEIPHLWAAHTINNFRESSQGGLNINLDNLRDDVQYLEDAHKRFSPEEFVFYSADGKSRWLNAAGSRSRQTYVDRWKHYLRLEVAYLRDEQLRAGTSVDKILLEVRQLESILGKLPEDSRPWWAR